MKKFIVTGYNKSGTTFLQQLLDAHPEVSCSPEHHIKTLIRELTIVSQKYKAVIEMFDNRTGRQGLRYRENRAIWRALRGFISEFFDESADAGLSAVGFNDNWIVDYLEPIRAMFPGVNFIFIVRDPRAVAVSLYHHLVRTEPHRVENIGLNQFCKGFGQLWVKHMELMRVWVNADGMQSTVVKYEELVGATKLNEMQRICSRLGVDGSHGVVEGCFTAVNKKSVSLKESGFYRSGKSNSWRDELSFEVAESIVGVCGAEMKNLGYLL